MASPVKVTYFNARALGEVIRMILKYGGIDFEDIRFEQEEWPKMKEITSSPFGQLPMYEEHGKVAYQSMAIARYLARKVNLVGENDWEDMEIDAIADTITDLRWKLYNLTSEADPEKKKAIRATLVDETFPYYLDRLESIALENNGHLAIAQLTWVDIYFASIVETVNFMIDSDILENRPNLQAVKDYVFEIPAIKDWVNSRPKTDT